MKRHGRKRGQTQASAQITPLFYALAICTQVISTEFWNLTKS